MAYQANVLNVMIACPGDVPAEREVVISEIYNWNAANSSARQMILDPVTWQSHSSPEMGSHPQSIINTCLLSFADIVVGIFWTRIGTATPAFPSGTVEEIERHISENKLVMLYFSKVPIDPTTVEQKQWGEVQAFKEGCRTRGLFVEFDSRESLRALFRHHLAVELNRGKYSLATPALQEPEIDLAISNDERRLLLAAASDRSGQILIGVTTDGYYVEAANENFVEDTPRSAAQWKRALKRLSDLSLIDQVGDNVYKVTAEGYAKTDTELQAEPLEISACFGGVPPDQVLILEATRRISVARLDFLMSTEAQVSEMKIVAGPSKHLEIPLDQTKVVQLFNARRSDRNVYDLSGPAKVRIAILFEGRRKDLILPVFLQANVISNAQWYRLSGSQRFNVD